MSDVHTDWFWINTIAQKCAFETDTICFQFKLTQRSITTNTCLKKIGRQDFDLGTFCNRSSETLINLFADSEYTEKL